MLRCEEVIAVNQAWAGHSGSPFKQSEHSVELTQLRGRERHSDVPSWQFFYKPIGGSEQVYLSSESFFFFFFFNFYFYFTLFCFC